MNVTGETVLLRNKRGSVLMGKKWKEGFILPQDRWKGLERVGSFWYTGQVQGELLWYTDSVEEGIQGAQKVVSVTS